MTQRAGLLPDGLPGSFKCSGTLFSLNPRLVEIETSDPTSLLEQARAGDPEAFGEVCRFHETHLLRQALTLSGNAALAEDLTEDTLVEAWKCLHRYNGRCQFFTWLCAILLHRYRNTVREKRPLTLSSLTGRDQDEFQDRLDQLTDHDPWPDQAAQRQEQSALVLECLRTLPTKHQQVLYLRFY